MANLIGAGSTEWYFYNPQLMNKGRAEFQHAGDAENWKTTGEEWTNRLNIDKWRNGADTEQLPTP